MSGSIISMRLCVGSRDPMKEVNDANFITGQVWKETGTCVLMDEDRIGKF